MVSHKIKVVVRIRPNFNDEDVCIEAVNDSTVDILNSRNKEECLRYEFSRVFNDTTSQSEVFEFCVKPLLKFVTCGENSSVFAYGPTGAGKTHTVLGTVEDPGLIPRTLLELFDITNKQMEENEWKYQIKFSYLEIYNEKAIDLLGDMTKDLPIREDKKKQLFIAGLVEKEIQSYDDFKSTFGPASQNRTTATTRLNEHSSRSHCILLIKVIKHQQCEPYRKLCGKLHLIDLAGSENNKRTGNKGIRLKESGAINTSLFVLGQVVDALNQGLPHVPYRDSKLTRLLQDSLGGNSHSVMITNLSPELSMHLDTYTSLNLAKKTRTVVNNTIINEVVERPKLGKRILPENHVISEKHPAKYARFSCSDSVNHDSDNLDISDDSVISPSISSQLLETVKTTKNVEELFHSLSHRLDCIEEKFAEQGAHHEMKDKNNENITDRHKIVSAGVIDNLKTRMKDLRDRILTPLKNIQANKNELDTDFQDIKSMLIREVTCSPLFLNPKGIKRKGFKSSAARKIKLDNSDSDESNFKKPPNPLNNDVVGRFSEEILKTLNTGTERDLQQLQTLGKKRSRLVINYREINGVFSNIDDLAEIPGFTIALVNDFKKKNFIAT